MSHKQSLMGFIYLDFRVLSPSESGSCHVDHESLPIDLALPARYFHEKNFQVCKTRGRIYRKGDLATLGHLERLPHSHVMTERVSSTTRSTVLFVGATLLASRTLCLLLCLPNPGQDWL